MTKPKTKRRLCKHCGGPIETRNSTGTCDHLYWPENLTDEAKRANGFDTETQQSEPKKFYRIEEEWRACYSVTEWSESMFDIARLDLVIKTFYEIKKTPKGSWIREITLPGALYQPPSRWVSDTAKKRYAYPSKKQAWKSFVAKRQSQIRILEGQLERAQIALETAKNMKEKLT